MKTTETKHKYLGLIVALCAILLATITLSPTLAQEGPDTSDGQQAPAGTTAVTSDPDFSTVDDPLNGDYELFTVDDLLIMRTIEDAEQMAQVNNYVMETASMKVSNQTRREVVSETCWLTGDQRQAQRTRIGRFFNFGYDVIVTLTTNSSATGADCSGANNMVLWVQDVMSTDKYATDFSLGSAQNTGVAMDDFNLDGFDDLVVLSGGGIVAATATDLDDPSQGMTLGALTAFSNTDLAPWSDPATGDLNADGIKEVAWIGYDYTVHYASVCPGSISGTVCDGKNALDLVLDPLQSQAKTIKVTKNTPLDPQEPGCTNAYALAIGDFTAHAGDGLVLLDCSAPNGSNVGIIFTHWYQFDSGFNSNLVETIGQQHPITGNQEQQYGSFAQAARLDWLGDYDQLVYAVGGASYTGSSDCYGITPQYTIGVLTFGDTTMSNFFTVGAKGVCTDVAAGPMLNGMAVGNFAAISDNPSNNSVFNQQIATLLNNGTIQIFEVSPPASFQPSLHTQSTVSSGLGVHWKAPADFFGVTSDPESFNWLVAGDLQGRSERLGAPSVMRLTSHSQPSVVLGAPPMHVDYVLPDETTSTTADIINFTAVPSSYFSQYTMSQKSSNQSSDTNKTSHAYSTSEKSSESLTLKPPYVPSISGSITKTTTDKSEDVASAYAFTQNEFQYDASTQTGFGDEIWYGVNSFNLYIYRVLGETICPYDNTNCTEEEEQPLYVMFSGPNSTGTGPASGSTTEWYQPVHEPGNIFSYPWNETILKKGFGSVQLKLLSGPQSFFTDGSPQSQSLNWTQNQGNDVSAGTVNSHDYEHGYSLTAGKTIGKIVDANISSNINYNDSTSVSTLNQSTSSMGASEGISIEKPGTFLNFSTYQYQVQPFLFGRYPNDSTVDKPALSQPITSTGPMQAAFVANPLAQGSGSWWTSSVNPYAQSIDVALNHPLRWRVQSGNGGLACLSGSNQNSDCVIFNDPLPDNLWSSQFYWMRGLFVTVNSTTGPQRDQATAGDTVYLTARVYNYSLMDLPSDATIKVRFYRQEVDGTVPSGDSVLISEEQMDPLPGFNSPNSPVTPNWGTTFTTFDTTGLDDTYHLFWVVAWAEDSNGNLLSELPGHGLGTKPGTLTSIGDVPLEMVTLDNEQRTFSNNVGYLHSKFYIAPSGTEALLPSPAPVLSIENAQATPDETSPGEMVLISADVRSQLAAADAVHVHFFPSAAAWQAHQDDPSQPPPRAFDVEQLPHIDEGESDQLEVPYYSAECGRQEVLVVAQSGALGEPATATAEFDNGPCQVYFPLLPLQLTN
jgi:hypothetical protein